MKVLLIGKTGSIIRWMEDMADDLRIGGHDVSVYSTRNPLLGKRLRGVLLAPSLGAPLAGAMVRRVRRLAPDLILAVGAFDHAPHILLEHLSHAAGRPPLAAWIGDAFPGSMRRTADLFDLIAYTDTGLLARHAAFGFQAASAFVPLAATRAFTAPPVPGGRDPSLAFVGAATENRRALLSGLTQPVTLYGPDWRVDDQVGRHVRDARRIDARELSQIYARHLGVLNIRHGTHVINGLNQRHFAPYIQGTASVSDAQPDIAHCFEIGREILVYDSADSLNALNAELRRDPARAHAVGLAGQRRVLAHHTYTHRLDAIAAACGLRARG